MKYRALGLALVCGLLVSAGCTNHSHSHRKGTPLPDYTNDDRKGMPLPDHTNDQKGTPLPAYTK